MVIFIVSIVFICLGQKLESLKNVWTNKYFSSVVMPSEDTKILEFNQYQKSDKRFCEFLREHSMKKINFKKNKK